MPYPRYEKQHGSGEDGSVSLSLNTIRPRAIEVVGRWAFHFSDYSSVHSVLDLLLRFSPLSSSSKADAAVFGMVVPWLVPVHFQ